MAKKWVLHGKCCINVRNRQRQGGTMPDVIDKKQTTASRLTQIQRAYLSRGLQEPGGKLPLFDKNGQRYKDQTIKACLKKGWCEPWYRNPLKPDWLVCKITPAGQKVLKAK